MSKVDCIVIFDIGKTNKKLLVFNDSYHLIHEQSTQFELIEDDEGYPTEDVALLSSWLKQSFREVLSNADWNVKALNFSGYGASLVNIDQEGQVVGFLKNYVKPVQDELFDQFFKKYGSADELARITCSPILGNLNSGYQAYEERHHARWQQIASVLHFPNYLGFLFHGERVTEMTSIGCHTLLWDFTKQHYHDWVENEEIDQKLPPIETGTSTFPDLENPHLQVGLGLHDSSAALVPYLRQFNDPFILISTGTWCISMNPFNDSNLTAEELANDVLAYMQLNGKQVKASRLFAGNEHEIVIKKLVKHFNAEAKFYKTVQFDKSTAKLFEEKLANEKTNSRSAEFLKASDFMSKELSAYSSIEKAYQDFMTDLVIQFLYSLQWVYKGTPNFNILVDGGFSKNDIFMNCLAIAFPNSAIYGAEVAQASSLGAALAIHESWNERVVPTDLIQLIRYLG